MSDTDPGALAKVVALTTPTPDINDDPSPVLAEDAVPTLDQQAPVAVYRDWRPEDTRVVVYRVGNNIYPGKFAETRDAARADCELLHGRILEANYVYGRAFFRVMKTNVR